MTMSYTWDQGLPYTALECPQGLLIFLSVELILLILIIVETEISMNLLLKKLCLGDC